MLRWWPRLSVANRVNKSGRDMANKNFKANNRFGGVVNGATLGSFDNNTCKATLVEIT